MRVMGRPATSLRARSETVPILRRIERRRSRRCDRAACDVRGGRVTVEVLGTSALLDTEIPQPAGRAVCGSGCSGDHRLVVHRSPIAGRAFALPGRKRSILLGKMEAPPGLEPGMEVLHRVVSCWPLVVPTPPFCLVFGPYWTTFGRQRPVTLPVAELPRGELIDRFENLAYQPARPHGTRVPTWYGRKVGAMPDASSSYRLLSLCARGLM